MAPILTVGFISLFISLALAMPGAMPWTGPMATPMGLMATAGISPRPTQAPTPEFLLGELRPRQNIIFPPPLNWCGFVNSIYTNPLSCSAGLTCVNSGIAMGCCTATTGICSALYTTCANYLDSCDAACQADPAVRKCSDAGFPFCGTYDFFGGTRLFNCQTTYMLPVDVEFLNDYYITAIGSTIGSASTAPLANSGMVSLGAVHSSGVAFSGGSATAIGGGSSPTSPTYSYSSGVSYTSGGGLSAVAIDGIAAGCSVGGAIILGLIIFFCVRSRRRRRMKRASNFNNPAYMPVTPMPPRQQQQQPQQQMQMPPKAFDGYHSVPQQESHQNPVMPQQQPQQYPQYYSPPMEQQKQPPASYFPPPAAAPSSPPANPDAHHASIGTAPSGLPPSSGLSPSPSNARESYYQPPISPDVREVDGTLGNPGIPSPMSAHGQHQATEVDGTLGNPSVPTGGHGIPSQQGVPGGSPSSTEIEGNPVRASLNAPFTADVYEMPHEHS